MIKTVTTQLFLLCNFKGFCTNMLRNKLVWMDLEMTGLDVDKCRVLEAAILVTDEKLNIVSPEFCTIIHQDEETLNNMNDWCRENLKDLAESSRKSNVNETQAENLMIDFISKYVEPKSSPLAGNSVYMDRLFLKKYFPRVDDYLHYRIVDTSTVKELCRRWNYPVYKSAPKKILMHRALDDIKESIQELKHYKHNFCVSK